MAVRIAVVGATGLVGGKVLEVMKEKNLDVTRVIPMASRRSLGQSVCFGAERLEVVEAKPDAFDGIDLAFFCAGTDVSKALAPEAVRRGAVVIDKSNAFRMDPEVPLVVPEVNPGALNGHKGIIASPNCSTIQLVVALKPLHDAAFLERVVVTTFQSVSGTGKEAVDELRSQSVRALEGQGVDPVVYPHPIAFNILPHIDDFDLEGYTGEEMKLVRETHKIMSYPDLPITPTATRVPVFAAHSEAVYLETQRPITPSEAKSVLQEAPGIVVADDPSHLVYPMPWTAQGRDEVFVGRIRRDLFNDNALNFWIVSDNLRKGAATNAVQIAQALLK